MMGGSSHSFWKSDAKLEVHSPVGLPGRAENGLSREDAEVPASVTKRGSATTVQGRQQQHAQGRMRLEDRYSAVRRLERQQHDGNRGTGGDGQPSARRGGGGGFRKECEVYPHPWPPVDAATQDTLGFCSTAHQRRCYIQTAH